MLTGVEPVPRRLKVEVTFPVATEVMGGKGSKVDGANLTWLYGKLRSSSVSRYLFHGAKVQRIIGLSKFLGEKFEKYVVEHNSVKQIRLSKYAETPHQDLMDMELLNLTHSNSLKLFHPRIRFDIVNNLLLALHIKHLDFVLA